MPDYARRPLPEAGAWRVHPQPDVLPRLSHDGPGANRYDDPVDGVRDWLAMQRVGRIDLAAPGPLLDVHDAELVRELDKHPLIREALEGRRCGARR